MRVKRMEKTPKCILLVLLTCICVALPTQSQVTIGTLSPPLDGILLDLKQDDVNDGSTNSEKGMKLPRVILTDINNLDPILKSTDPNYSTAKASYTGTVVYNVSTVSPFEKGFYAWNGTQWMRFLTGGNEATNLDANNGLSMSGDYVQLGGSLVKATTVDLDSYDLAFTRNTGNSGIGVNAPKAALHVADLSSADPVRLTNLATINNPSTTAGYSNVVVSEAGVVRTSPLLTGSGTDHTYRLNSDQTIATGNSSGSNGTFLNWIGQGGATNSQYVILPHDGVFIFMLRLYGTHNAGSSGTSSCNYYVFAYKGTTANAGSIVDATEIILNRVGSSRFNYRVMLAVAGEEGDAVRIKVSQGGSIQWQLRTTASVPNAQKTSMTYWPIQ